MRFVEPRTRSRTWTTGHFRTKYSQNPGLPSETKEGENTNERIVFLVAKCTSDRNIRAEVRAKVTRQKHNENRIDLIYKLCTSRFNMFFPQQPNSNQTTYPFWSVRHEKGSWPYSLWGWGTSCFLHLQIQSWSDESGCSIKKRYQSPNPTGCSCFDGFKPVGAAEAMEIGKKIVEEATPTIAIREGHWIRGENKAKKDTDFRGSQVKRLSLWGGFFRVSLGRRG